MNKIKKLIVALILGLFLHFGLKLNVGAVPGEPDRPQSLEVGQIWTWQEYPQFSESVSNTYPIEFTSNNNEFIEMNLGYIEKGGYHYIDYVRPNGEYWNIYNNTEPTPWNIGNNYKTFTITDLSGFNTTSTYYTEFTNIIIEKCMYVGMTTPTYYNVQFSANGGTGTTPNALEVEEGTVIQLQDYLDVDLQKTGYTFNGWNTSPTATTALATVTVTDNINLYAVWDAIPVYYEITWNSNGATSGEPPLLIDKLAGSTLDLANYNPGNLSREKYRFLGWNTSPTATTALNSVVVNDRMILYAIWERVAPWETTIVIQGIGSPEYNGEISFINNTFNFILDWRNSFLPTLTFDNVTTGQLTSINGNVVNMVNNTLILPLNSYTYTIALHSLQVQVSKIGEPGYIYNKRYIYINGDDDLGMVEQPYGKLLTFTEFQNTFTGSTQLEPLGENYKITITISFDKAKIQDSETNWENFTDITENMWDLIQGFLNIKIGFVTIGNILGMVIGFAIVGFIIKMWLGSGNNG